jgi:hypothetical protein
LPRLSKRQSIRNQQELKPSNLRNLSSLFFVAITNSTVSQSSTEENFAKKLKVYPIIKAKSSSNLTFNKKRRFAGEIFTHSGFDVTAAQTARGYSFYVLQKASNPALRRDFDLLLDYLRKNVYPVIFDGEDCRLVEMQFK